MLISYYIVYIYFWVEDMNAKFPACLIGKQMEV